MPELLIATENRGKRRELQQLLGGLTPSTGPGSSLQLVLPSEVGLVLKVEETGSTYAENAALKAIAYARASGLTALADDSGLEVDALNGAPGLFSARYGRHPPPSGSPQMGTFGGREGRGEIESGEEKEGGRDKGGPHTDADRRAHLLQNLRGKPRPWTARFHATIAVATPAGEVRYAEGVCPGEIIPDERGTGGFGYDPIFLLEGQTQTMAELGDEEKNRLSHRGRAARAAIPILREMLGI